MIKIDIKEYLFNTLNCKNIIDLTSDKKVYFLHANSPNTPYIEYEIISEQGEYYDEGNEKYTEYLIQVDIFSTDDYSIIENEIKNIMINAGYKRSQALDLYENKTNLYHKVMRFNISLPFLDGKDDF